MGANVALEFRIKELLFSVSEATFTSVVSWTVTRLIEAVLAVLASTLVEQAGDSKDWFTVNECLTEDLSAEDDLGLAATGDLRFIGSRSVELDLFLANFNIVMA